MKKHKYARIPLYLAALSLVFPLAACGGDAAVTEGELQIVTQAPLVTTRRRDGRL